MEAIVLLTPIVAGLLIAGLIIWLGRATRRPALTFYISGGLLLAAGVYGLAQGYRLLPVLFVIQACGFLYFARSQSQPTAGSNPPNQNG